MGSRPTICHPAATGAFVRNLTQRTRSSPSSCSATTDPPPSSGTSTAMAEIRVAGRPQHRRHPQRVRPPRADWHRTDTDDLPESRSTRSARRHRLPNAAVGLPLGAAIEMTGYIGRKATPCRPPGQRSPPRTAHPGPAAVAGGSPSAAGYGPFRVRTTDSRASGPFSPRSSRCRRLPVSACLVW
jgi:hypothetical protein